MLSLSSEDYFLEEVDSHIQANLEDSVVQEALKSGVDLREYSTQVEEELKLVENQSIQDYIRESGNIASLRNQITNCDQILERMEKMLLTFQNDLGSISSEILELQQASVQMNLKLTNRQAVKSELSQYVGDILIPEYMIHTISDTPVTDTEFLMQLQQLEQKINFLKEQSFRDSRSSLDVKDVVEKLKMKAIQKIREHLLEKINAFKKPMCNYELLQNSMKKFNFYFTFLASNNRDIAMEVRTEYIDTQSKALFSYFKSYSGRLAKLQYNEVATRDDLMGHADTDSGPSWVTGLFNKSGIKSKASVFSMGDRADILGEKFHAPVIVPHVQQKTDTKFAYEILFWSVQYSLMSTACSEYAFVKEFFNVSPSEANELFHQIMVKCFGILVKNVDQNVQESYDSISLFLCFHLAIQLKEICQGRCGNVTDAYWNNILNILWSRLKLVMEMNIQSISDIDPMKIKAVDTRPHYITRRYAEFVGGILSVNESHPSEKVLHLLADMQQKVEQFILKMAIGFSNRRKEHLKFLINNYDLILSVISERSHLESKESHSFKDLLSTSTLEYINHVLNPHFGDLVKFVQRCEILLQESKRDDSLRQEWDSASVLLRNFNSGWQKSLDQINDEVLSSFPNLKNGTNILQQALTQFVQHYHGFHRILSHESFNSHPDRQKLLNIHQLMVEVKKYKPNF